MNHTIALLLRLRRSSPRFCDVPVRSRRPGFRPAGGRRGAGRRVGGNAVAGHRFRCARAAARRTDRRPRSRPEHFVRRRSGVLSDQLTRPPPSTGCTRFDVPRRSPGRWATTHSRTDCRSPPPSPCALPLRCFWGGDPGRQAARPALTGHRRPSRPDTGGQSGIRRRATRILMWCWAEPPGSKRRSCPACNPGTRV